jgi:hypothetical protein
VSADYIFRVEITMCGNISQWCRTGAESPTNSSSAPILVLYYRWQFFLRSYSYTLKMGAGIFFETPVHICQATRVTTQVISRGLWLRSSWRANIITINAPNFVTALLRERHSKRNVVLGPWFQAWFKKFCIYDSTMKPCMNNRKN